MAGCLPCFIIPLLLFIFHRFIQPIILKFWNPWEKKGVAPPDCKDIFSCPCNIKAKPNETEEQALIEPEEEQAQGDKLKVN